MKIDIFSHVFPELFRKTIIKYNPALESHRQFKQFQGQPGLYDMEFRTRMLSQYGEILQVITLGEAPVDMLPNKEAIEVYKVGNNSVAEIVDKYPNQFIGVASLPLSDMDAALKETDRAIGELGFKGIQLPTNLNGTPIDSEEFLPLYEKMMNYDLPIWIHPHRDNTVPDYINETQSKFGIHAFLGWPFETSVTMTRIVFSGILEKFPSLKIITHHCGGMIPYFKGRIAHFYDLVDHDGLQGEKPAELGLTKRPTDYFRMFYNDTAICGSTPALMCGYEYFGVDHILFGTDVPMDNEHGYRLLRETIQSVEDMDISDEDKQKIFYSNAKKLLHL